jgi:hypothetical protein
MSIDTTNDPRNTLVRTKYFSLHPKPLERWLWQQDLPQTAERVFWLHWEEGMRSGDWCSEIPIKRVALECAADPSTVTRAYQVLKNLGLIHREDPGRAPDNPFQQATAITEVRLPREFIVELGRSPNRASVTRNPPTSPPISATPEPSVAEEPAAKAPGIEQATLGTPAPESEQSKCTVPAVFRLTREAIQSLWGRASADERTRYYAATQARRTTFEFAPDTQLTAEDQVYLLAQLQQQAIARPEHSPVAPAKPVSRPPTGPRRLSTLQRARIRRGVLEAVTPTADGTELVRQVLWAIEVGALRRFPVELALNIARKKLREGAWTKPHRLPPNWLPAGPSERAVPEPCGAA